MRAHDNRYADGLFSFLSSPRSVLDSKQVKPQKASQILPISQRCDRKLLASNLQGRVHVAYLELPLYRAVFPLAGGSGSLKIVLTSGAMDSQMLRRVLVGLFNRGGLH